MAALQHMPDEVQIQIYSHLFRGLRVKAIPPGTMVRMASFVPPPTGGLAVVFVKAFVKVRGKLVHRALAEFATFIVDSERGLNHLRSILGTH